jgi:hypothetical protein
MAVNQRGVSTSTIRGRTNFGLSKGRTLPSGSPARSTAPRRIPTAQLPGEGHLDFRHLSPPELEIALTVPVILALRFWVVMRSMIADATNPPVDAHARVPDHLGGNMHRHPEKKVVGDGPTICGRGDVRRWVQRDDELVGQPLDLALGTGESSASDTNDHRLDQVFFG